MKTLLKIAFAVWVVLWISFTARELFVKGALKDYKVLLSRSLEGKRAYVTGDKFYGFLTFCRANMPAGVTYGLAGVNKGPGKENIDPSLLERRAFYYLYPYLPTEEPEYILVYEESGIKKDGYYRCAKLDDNSYILKNTGRHNWK
jgi:hypothetical protein